MKLGKPAGRRIAALATAVTLGSAGVLVAAMSAPLPARPTAATPTSSVPLGEVAVPQGLGPAVLKNASVFGTTPPDTGETVSFVLRGRDLAGLEDAVESGQAPDLSVAQFASRYGQTAAAIGALESYLNQYGIATTRYPDDLDVVASGTAGEFDSALNVQQQQYDVPAVPAHDGMGPVAATRVHGTTQEPYLPASIAPAVLAVLGLTNYAPFSASPAHTPKGVASSNSPAPTATYTGNLTPADFAANYDLNPLYRDGISGQGETLGIVTLAGFDPATAEYFWNNVLHITTATDRISVDNVDGGPGAPSQAAGSGESDLDVEQSGALAPDASIVVYQAPNTDYGFADAFFTAASQNLAGTLSSSWGESETVLLASVKAGQEDPAYAQALDEAFLELAAQGQSTFVAAGDSGAYDSFRGHRDGQPVRRQPRRQPVRHQRGRHHAGRHDHRHDRRPEHPGLDSRPADLGLGLAMAALRDVRLPVGSGVRAGGAGRGRRRLQRDRAHPGLPAGPARLGQLQCGGVPDPVRVLLGRRPVPAHRLDVRRRAGCAARVLLRPGPAGPGRGRRPVHRLPAV